MKTDKLVIITLVNSVRKITTGRPIHRQITADRELAVVRTEIPIDVLHK